MFKNRKNLFLLVYWVAQNSKMYEKSRSSCPEVFREKVLKNFAKFAGKYLRWSLSLTVTGLSCFHVNFVKCLRTPNL